MANLQRKLAFLLLVLSLPFIGGGTHFAARKGIQCDDCSGDLSFACHWEGSDASDRLDIETGNPCGCSDGDTTGTIEGTATTSNSQKSDGSYSVHIPTCSDEIQYDITSEDIAQDNAGTITFDIYIVSWVDDARLCTVWVDNDETNAIYIMMRSSDEIRLRYVGNNNAQAAVTNGANLSLNTWYSVTAKWRHGATDPSLYIDVNSVSASNNNDLVAFSSSPNQLSIGDTQTTGAPEYYIDNFKVYKTWQ